MAGTPDDFDSPLQSERLRQELDSAGSRAVPVTIPWQETVSLHGDYLPVAGREIEPAPAVICIAEQRGSHAQLLALMAPRARDRGLALLCVDLASDDAREALARSRRPETCVTAMIDALADLPGIDPARIAVIGDGSPSSLVAKGVALDGRAAAAVCDAGLWELWEHAHSGIGGGALGAIAQPPVPPAIRCPTLIALRPGDGIDPAHAEQLLAAHAPGRTMAVVTFAVPGGSRPTDIDGADAILDWVSRQLQPAAAPRREAGRGDDTERASD